MAVKLSQVTGDPLDERFSGITCPLFNIYLQIRYLSDLDLEDKIETFSGVLHDRDRFLSDEYGPDILVSILAKTGSSPEVIPSIYDLARILSEARVIEKDPLNFGRNVITLKLEVTMVDDHETVDDDDTFDGEVRVMVDHDDFFDDDEVTVMVDHDDIFDDEVTVVTDSDEVYDDEVMVITDTDGDEAHIDDDDEVTIITECDEVDDADENNDDDDDVVELIDELLTTLNFTPATSSSIQALKRFKWGDGDEEEDCLPLKKRRRLLKSSSSMKECTICFDEFSDGDEVAPMPCGHVYHDACIVEWLNTSHLCPLCRYPMPN